MDFKTPYLLALAERDPKLLWDCAARASWTTTCARSSSRPASWRRSSWRAARAGMAEEREAEEQVFATLIDFPSAEE